MKKRIIAMLIAVCTIVTLLPVTAMAEDLPDTMAEKMPDTVQMSGADSAAPAPELPENHSPKGRMSASAITFAGDYVFANGIPIVIKTNESITSIYSTDGTLLSGETDVTQKWICGGVFSSAYEGNTSVTLESGTVASILGGSYGGNITGNTNVTINGGTVNMLFGGGRAAATVNGNTYIAINAGNVTGWVYGGGAVYEGDPVSDVNGDTHVTLNGGSVGGNIYGGGSWRGASVTNSNVTINGGSVTNNVFGGGENASAVTGKATVIIDGNPTIGYGVYGGGAGFDSTNATVNSTDIQVKSGNLGAVFGGGAGFNGVSNTTGDVSISVSGGTINDVAASDNASSKVTGNVSISLTGGTIKNSCHLAGFYLPDNDIKDVSLVVGPNMSFGENFYEVNLSEPISGDLNIDIDGTFAKLHFYDDVLPDGKEAKVTYRNIGSASGTWTNYSSAVAVPGTNPQMNSPGTQYGSPMFANNKLTEFALVNSYVDFKDKSLSNKAQDFASFTDKLTLDGGALRCYFLMDSHFPVTEFKNDPLLYYGYAYLDSEPSKSTSTMNFAGTTGTARVQLLNNSGVVTDDPLYGRPVKPSGVSCVVAPSDAPDNTFSLQNNALSEGKQFWGTSTVTFGGSGEVMKLWQVRDANSCCCFLGQTLLKDISFYLDEQAEGFTLADYRDGADVAPYTQSCPIIGHKQGEFQVTYRVNPEGTTALGAAISGNQLTATGAGTVMVDVTAQLNGRESSGTASVHVGGRPEKKSYFFRVDPTSGDYKDVVLTYTGDKLNNNGVRNLTNSVPPDLAWLTAEQCKWTYNEGKTEATATITKEYLKSLGDVALKEYKFDIALTTNGFSYMNDEVTVLVSDKEPSALTLTANKTENLVYGDSVTYQAAVSRGNADSAADMTGTVQFALDGAPVGDPMPLATASITLDHAALTAGKHSVTAAYSGDGNYAGSDDKVAVSVAKAALTVKPKDVKITAGAALPALEVECAGLADGDTAAVAALESGTLDMACRNAANDGALADTNTAGAYKIAFTGAPVFKAAANYTIATGDGTLTIASPPSSGGTPVTPPLTIVTPPATPENPNPSTTVKTEVTGKTDSSGKAAVTVKEKSVTDAIKKAQGEAKKNGTEENGIAIVLDVLTDKSATTLETALPAAAVKALVEAGITEVVVQNSLSTITLDLATLHTLAGGAVKLTISEVATATLSVEAKAALGSRPVLQYVVMVAGNPVTDFKGGKVTVQIPYILAPTEQAGNLCGVFIDDSGKLTWMEPSTYDSNRKMLTFSTSHFSVFGVGYRENAPKFTDTDSHWAKDDIAFVAARGLLKGTGSTTFAPDTSMTRGMFVTALGRLAGVDTKKFETTKFTDVKADAYYAPHVAWANVNGIVKGTSDTTFSPDTSITREQMAVILVNYSKAIGYQLPSVHAEAIFADSASIGAWAKGAVKQMQMAGILMGKSGNRFDPTATATRAEVATMLRRFVELVETIETTEGQAMKESAQ